MNLLAKKPCRYCHSLNLGPIGQQVTYGGDMSILQKDANILSLHEANSSSNLAPMKKGVTTDSPLCPLSTFCDTSVNYR